MQTPNAHQISFLTLVVLVTAAFIWLLLPYYSALLWAGILAILFHPLQRRLTRKLGGRRTVAAALNLLICVCIVLIPASLIFSSLVQEATSLYERITSREMDPTVIVMQLQSVLPEVALRALEALDMGNFEEIQSRLRSFLAQSSQAVATRLLSIGQGTAHFFVGLGVMPKLERMKTGRAAE